MIMTQSAAMVGNRLSRLVKTLKLISFDANATLISVARDIGSEYAKIATIYGVQHADDPQRIAVINEKFSDRFKQHCREHPNFGAHTPISAVEWWTKLVLQLFGDAGFAVATDETERKRIQSTAAHLYKLYSRGTQWQLKPGAGELLQALRVRHPHIQLVVASNFDDRLHTILRDLGLTHYFRHVYTSREMGLAKPDVEFFQHILRKFQQQQQQQQLQQQSSSEGSTTATTSSTTTTTTTLDQGQGKTKASVSSTSKAPKNSNFISQLTTKIDPFTEYLHIGDSIEMDAEPVVNELGGNCIVVSSSTTTSTSTSTSTSSSVNNSSDGDEEKLFFASSLNDVQQLLQLNNNNPIFE